MCRSGTLWKKRSYPSEHIQHKEEVAQLFTKYDFLAIPVLDADGRMVGIVTFDDAMDVMVEEATEDIIKNGSHQPE